MSPIDTRADKQDIAEVLVRYATGIDGRDWNLFRTCFTHDVRCEYEGIATWTDVEEITRFMIDAHASMGSTQHRLSNMVIDVGGDTATARTYVDAILLDASGTSGLSSTGQYDDELVRSPDGWRIRRRRFTAICARAIEGLG